MTENECEVKCGINYDNRFTCVLDVNQKLIKNVLRSKRYERCNYQFKSKIKYTEKFDVQEDRMVNGGILGNVQGKGSRARDYRDISGDALELGVGGD